MDARTPNALALLRAEDMDQVLADTSLHAWVGMEEFKGKTPEEVAPIVHKVCGCFMAVAVHRAGRGG